MRTQVRVLCGTFACSAAGGQLAEVLKPLQLTKRLAGLEVRIQAHGGGIKGQAGAARLAVSRALVTLIPAARTVLKPNKMLRRDPRMVERKKPGQKKARKKFQWVKR